MGKAPSEYRCSRCKRGAEDGVTREVLMVKRVQFMTMGAAPRTLRSRVVEWLCPNCVKADADWQLPAGHTPDISNLPNQVRG